MTSISKVLISGGTGFVGSWMERTQPDSIDALYLNHTAYPTRWETGDWDSIVHLAPCSPNRILHYARKHDARVLYASSGAVYQGVTDYAFDKREYELECVHSEVDVTIARLFTFIGARLKDLYAVTHFIKAAQEGKPLQVQGDGSSTRSYLYGEDLGKWMWRLLLDGKRDAYDVGSSYAYTIAELALMVQSVIPCKIEILNDKHFATHYLPNTDKAKALGCKETVSLKEAIEKVIHESI